jgi:hypothetical protein
MTLVGLGMAFHFRRLRIILRSSGPWEYPGLRDFIGSSGDGGRGTRERTLSGYFAAVAQLRTSSVTGMSTRRAIGRFACDTASHEPLGGGGVM